MRKAEKATRVGGGWGAVEFRKQAVNNASLPFIILAFFSRCLKHFLYELRKATLGGWRHNLFLYVFV